MKKIITLIIGIVISIASFSQTFYKVNKATIVEYENGEWVDKNYTYPEKMYIIVDGSNIKITNESESKFVLYGEPEITTYSTHNTYTWGCYDKKGNSCKFMLKKSNNGSTTMSILYLQELYTLQYNVEIQ